ncbi:unnamed protein product [Diabrotica balteata]|uniref:Uncharacterized protein n=1 Tax=Diabrotica balteata TaxID=107213 RepID=A0A9P0DXA1_DIABA|nr:unnamed protein product [Diabrotica balteata]
MLNYIATRSVSFTPRMSHRLIKFRYGLAKTQQAQPAAASKSGIQGGQQAQGQGAVLWDFELPPRFRRKAIDDSEIAVINNGGPL